MEKEVSNNTHEDRLRVLRENLIKATCLLPGFILGHVICVNLVSVNWAVCLALCMGAFTFAVVDGVDRMRGVE